MGHLYQIRKLGQITNLRPSGYCCCRGNNCQPHHENIWKPRFNSEHHFFQHQIKLNKHQQQTLQGEIADSNRITWPFACPARMSARSARKSRASSCQGWLWRAIVVQRTQTQRPSEHHGYTTCLNNWYTKNMKKGISFGFFWVLHVSMFADHTPR